LKQVVGLELAVVELELAVEELELAVTVPPQQRMLPLPRL
jgi:hypothetical protein